MKWTATLLLILVACGGKEVVSTDTAQSTTGITNTTSVAPATTSTTDTSATMTPGTTAPAPTATETTAPASPAQVSTAPGVPSATKPATTKTKKSAALTATAPASTPAAAPPPSTATQATITAAPTPVDTAPPPANPIAEGQKIFNAKCTGCHGVDGRKPANGHVLASAEVQNKSDAELARILHEGAGKMSAIAHKRAALTDEQIRAVVAYVKALR
ncbi:MAG TPA: cytochrome c [Thermoanaerobaculia bacterium]